MKKAVSKIAEVEYCDQNLFAPIRSSQSSQLTTGLLPKEGNLGNSKADDNFETSARATTAAVKRRMLLLCSL